MKNSISFWETRTGGLLYYTSCIVVAASIGILAKRSQLNKTMWLLFLIISILVMLGGIFVLVVARKTRSKVFTLPGELPPRSRREAISLILFAIGLWAAVCLMFPL